MKKQPKDTKQFERSKQNKIRRIKKDLLRNPSNTYARKRLEELEK